MEREGLFSKNYFEVILLTSGAINDTYVLTFFCPIFPYFERDTHVRLESHSAILLQKECYKNFLLLNEYIFGASFASLLIY